MTDKGYRGHGVKHLSKEVILPYQRVETEKAQKGVGICYGAQCDRSSDWSYEDRWSAESELLKGGEGDAMYVILCAVGQNMRLLLKAIECFLLRWIFCLSSAEIRKEGYACPV